MRRLARALAASALLAGTAAGPAASQIRPVEPTAWHRLEAGDVLYVGIGGSVFLEQDASLAGTRGTLYDLAEVLVAWKTGRVLIEVAGPLVRRFDDDEVLEPPAPGVDAPDGTRSDAGEVRVETTMLLAGGGPAALALRFGTRLPTTSVEPGLGRDRTDFYALLGARRRLGRLALAAEAGVGIFGTRGVASPEQSDVLTWAAGLELDAGAVTPTVYVLGHDDLHRRRVRGSEDLSEVRVGLRTGGRLWLHATAVHGLADYASGPGAILMAGLRL